MHSTYQCDAEKTIGPGASADAPGHVGVIGSGRMGIQITDQLLQLGYRVILKTRYRENIETINSKLLKKMSIALQEKDVGRCLEKLTITTDYYDLKDVDVVIETSIEDVDVKKEIFSALSDVCKPETLFSTNTSSISIDALAAATDRPDRFVGLHFFNPLHRMALVEIIIGARTSDMTKKYAISFAQGMNKKPIIVKNGPGFVVNRLLLPQINEAVHLLGDGIASKEDIDAAVKLGLNHPMGPFELADLIGLDTCLSILDVLHTDLGYSRLEPAPLLREMVERGRLGRKSGEGFYIYR